MQNLPLRWIVWVGISREFRYASCRYQNPRRLKAVLHYGFCHPAAKDRRQRVAFHTGRPLIVAEEPTPAPSRAHPCPGGGAPMRLAARYPAAWTSNRAPPNQLAACT